MQYAPWLVIILAISVGVILYQNKEAIRKAQQKRMCKLILKNVSKVVGAKIKVSRKKLKVGNKELTPQEFAKLYEQSLKDKGYVLNEDGDYEKKGGKDNEQK